MVAWDMVPLMDQNGVITMYEVLYGPLETFNGTIGPLTETVQAPNLATTLTELQEFVTYNIRVRAVTNGGNGVYSEAVEAMTPEDG